MDNEKNSKQGNGNRRPNNNRIRRDAYRGPGKPGKDGTSSEVILREGNLIQFEKINHPKHMEVFTRMVKVPTATTEAEAYNLGPVPTTPTRDPDMDDATNPNCHQLKADYDLAVKMFLADMTSYNRKKDEMEDQKISYFNRLRSVISDESWELVKTWPNWRRLVNPPAAPVAANAANPVTNNNSGPTTRRQRNQSSSTTSSTTSSNPNPNPTSQSSSTTTNPPATTQPAAAAAPAAQPAPAPAAPAPVWITVEEEKCPWKLLQAIRATHHYRNTGNHIMDIQEAWNAYYRIRQRPDESLHDYMEFLQKRIDALEALGETPPLEELIAVRFITTLDDARYLELKNILNSNVATGVGQYPRTVHEAYQLAMNHKPTKTRHGVKKISTVAYITQKNEGKGKGSHNGNQKGNNNQDAKKKRVPYCHVCKAEAGHWTNECEKVLKAIEDTEPAQGKGKSHTNLNTVVTKIDFHTVVKAKVYQSECDTPTSFGPRDIILDNAANAAVCANPQLIRNIRKVNHKAEIAGYGGKKITTNLMGDFINGLGPAYYCPEGKVNLVPLGQLEMNYEMRWERNKRFVVTTAPGVEVSFMKSHIDEQGNGFYVYTPEDKFLVLAFELSTVEENKKRFTKWEVERAKAAKDFMKRTGFMSEKEAIRAITSGAIMNCPVTVQDILNKMEIWGEEIASIKGKTTFKKSKVYDDVPLPFNTGRQVSQVMYADLMHMDKQCFLVTTTGQLNLKVIVDLHSNRSADNIAKALQSIILTYRMRGYNIRKIVSDREGGIISPRTEAVVNMQGVELDTAAAGQHVGKIERAIRTIKDRMRSIIMDLGYRLPNKLLGSLAETACRYINAFPTPSSNDNIPPWEYFTGRKVDYERDFRYPFGTVVEATTAYISSNIRKPRTVTAIIVGFTGNSRGSLRCCVIGTGRFITCDHVKPIVVTEEIKNAIEAMDGIGSKKGEFISHADDYPEMFAHEGTHDDVDNDVSDYQPGTVADMPPNEDGLEYEDDEEYQDDGTEQVIQLIPEDAPEDYEPPLSSADISEKNIIDTPNDRSDGYALRPGKRKFYGYRISVKKALMSPRYRDPALRAIVKEMFQMSHLGVFDPVEWEKMTREQRKKIIRSFMFLKEKFKADGSFEKLKARLCAMGNEWLDQSMETSSPTASLQSVLMVAAIAAKEGRKVRTADVPGAYLNAEMPIEVFMSIDPTLAGIMIAINPKKFGSTLKDDGTIVVRLKKAMYGHTLSSKLWYEKISQVLKDDGFVPNAVDSCVFNKTMKGVQCTICVYVDDLMMTCVDDSVLDEVSDMLKKNFEGIKPTGGPVHSYLGMLFDFSVVGEVKITMEHFIKELLDKYPVEGENGGAVSTPALANLFDVREDSPLLNDVRRQLFHSIVAMLLYLAKRVRPDILTAVSFLATRVTKATEDDWTRLMRVLKYLKGDPGTGIVLRPGSGQLKVTASADSAYGVHKDGKSHSGLCIALGEGPIFVRSAKQKIVSKSSTEAELISLTDGCSQVIWSRDFLISQGYEVGPATIYQDNMSTIAMANAGKATSDRTRHIHVRYFFVKDRMESGEIEIQYLNTDEMTADFLSKPLVGAKFQKLKKKLLNWYY